MENKISYPKIIRNMSTRQRIHNTGIIQFSLINLIIMYMMILLNPSLLRSHT